MGKAVPAPLPPARAALWRGSCFLALWVVLMGGDTVGLAVGTVTAAAAAATSLHLVPPAAGRLRLAALPGFALRFLWQAVRGGWDVAWRALHPRLPVRPGFAIYQVALPPGLARNLFTTLTSLLPGTVPAGDAEGGLLYHCLDVEQPVAAQLAAEEAALSRVLDGSASDA